MMFEPRNKGNGIGKDAFIKLDEGQEIMGLFAGKPHQFKQHWVNNRSSVCSGPECALCENNPDDFPRFRFRVNFVTSKDGKYVAKVFEGGGQVFDSLVSLGKKFDLAQTTVEISRTGKGKDTRYTVLPRPDIKLGAPILKEIAAVKLHDLAGEHQDE